MLYIRMIAYITICDLVIYFVNISYLLSYLPLSRLSFILDQVAGILLSIPIISRLSVIVCGTDVGLEPISSVLETDVLPIELSPQISD